MINSAALAGWRNICPTIWFLSITSGVLFVSSITTLNANNPCLCCTFSKYGLTKLKNLFLVAAVLFSNIKNLVVLAINFLAAINNLLTFTLSNADAFFCNVFCPNTTTPLLGKVAIGLTLLSYNVSLLAWVNFLSVWTAISIPPLLRPAGANHGAATLSLKAYTLGITVDAGTQTFLPKSASGIFTHGHYSAT